MLILFILIHVPCIPTSIKISSIKRANLCFIASITNSCTCNLKKKKKKKKKKTSNVIIIEPVREKTNNLGFRPGLTQTRLHSHTIKLEA